MTMQIEDINLVQRVQSELPQQTNGFNELAKQYYPLVRKTCNSVLRNAEDADNVAQEVMLRALRHLPALQNPETFEGWLRRIAVNAAKSYISLEIRERNKIQRLFGMTTPSTDAPDISPAKPLDEHWQHTGGSGLYHWLLTLLSTDERSILAYRFVSDLAFGEIASRMDMQVSATKMRYYRALDKLRSQLETEVDDAGPALRANAG